MLFAGVANRQLTPTASTAQKPRQKGRTMLGCAVMSALRDVITDHLADCLCSFPTYVAFMCARLQCQPFITILPASNRRPEPHRCPGLAVGIGSAIGRIDDHTMDGSVGWPLPNNVTLLAKGGQFKVMFKEPHEGLPRASQLDDLIEDQTYGILHAAIRIFLEPVGDLHEADGSGDDKFAAPCLLVACREGSLPEEIEFVLVQAPFQAQQ